GVHEPDGRAGPARRRRADPSIPSGKSLVHAPTLGAAAQGAFKPTGTTSVGSARFAAGAGLAPAGGSSTRGNGDRAPTVSGPATVRATEASGRRGPTGEPG